MAVNLARSISGGVEIDGYFVGKTIGRGNYSKVKLGWKVDTGQKVAVKVLKKKRMNQRAYDRCEREVKILALLKHPHIARLYKTAETDDKLYLVMEFCPRGELRAYVDMRGMLDEATACKLFRQLVSAVGFCHKNFIVHRDIKAENILLSATEELKLIDFGFTNTYEEDSVLSSFCGTPLYASPEIVSSTNYKGPEVDIWSLGVILYFMVSGHMPFSADSASEVFNKISHGVYTSPIGVSESCLDVIAQALVVDHWARAEVDDLASHPWVCGHGELEAVDYLLAPVNRQVSEPLLQAIRFMGYDIDGVRADLLKDDVDNAGLRAYYIMAHFMERRAAKSEEVGQGKSVSMTEVRTKATSPRLDPRLQEHKKTKRMKDDVWLFADETAQQHAKEESVYSDEGEEANDGGKGNDTAEVNTAGPIPLEDGEDALRVSTYTDELPGGVCSASAETDDTLGGDEARELKSISCNDLSTVMRRRRMNSRQLEVFHAPRGAAGRADSTLSMESAEQHSKDTAEGSYGLLGSALSSIKSRFSNGTRSGDPPSPPVASRITRKQHTGGSDQSVAELLLHARQILTKMSIIIEHHTGAPAKLGPCYTTGKGDCVVFGVEVMHVPALEQRALELHYYSGDRNLYKAVEREFYRHLGTGPPTNPVELLS